MDPRGDLRDESPVEAIATALVAPLCSVGLSLAYNDVTNAQGAALLFATNFLAIVLSAAITFRIIGSTAELHPGFADELVAIVRQKMRDQSLVVDVHCVNELWQRRRCDH